MKRVRERKQVLRGVVESFDNNKRKGEIRFEDKLYKIGLLDIKQEASMLPENETVTFEFRHTEQGDKAINVRTSSPRKRGKVFYLGAESGKIKATNGNVYLFS